MFSRNVLRSEQSVKHLALFNLEGTERIDNWQLTIDNGAFRQKLRTSYKSIVGKFRLTDEKQKGFVKV